MSLNFLHRNENYDAKWKHIYDQLGELFKDVQDIAIVRIEFEPYQHFLEDEKVKKLPIIRLYRKGNNKKYSYKGKFKLESIKTFLEEKILEEDREKDEL